MHFLFAYIQERRRVLAAALVCLLIFAAAFALYRLPLAAVLYPAALCLICALVFAGFDYRRTKRKVQALEKVQNSLDVTDGLMPPTEGVTETAYRAVIDRLCARQDALQHDMERRFDDTVNYYTVWAHQIKTPIASMRLKLQNEDSDFSRSITADLLRIEGYVEMVLAFLRLDSTDSDYVIREYDLDPIVRQAVRKFAGEFISRNLKLEYTSLDTTVLTDEKWLSFVIEQVLSNALKYTPSGCISITLEPRKTLCIRDTGIGVAPEDLPRIFERGYTGWNGRVQKTASGLGLYLCKRICENLGHTITAASEPGQGTTVRIGLDRAPIEHE